MKRHRVWLEIVVLGTVMAIALALFLATIGVAAGLAEPPNEAQQAKPVGHAGPPAAELTYEGMVTCSQCGAKHSPALGRPATVCVRVCVHGGASFTLVSADSTYLLKGDSEALKNVAGQRARVVGNLHDKTIDVVSVIAEG